MSKTDVVRRRIQALLTRDALTLAEVSRAIGRNHAYLQQFLRRGTPKALPEEVRIALARYLGIDETELRVPLGGELHDPLSDAGGHQRRVPRSFAARLSIARAESVFETPSSFAEAAGIDRLRYADLEEGEDSPTLEELDQISHCSGKPLDWLIRGETMPSTPSADVISPLGADRRVDGNPGIYASRRRRRDYSGR